MKNLFTLTVFAIVALTSCQKDYTCECKGYIDGINYASESQTINDTKSNAIESCDTNEVYYNDGVSILEIKCEIK
jgi:hypothetical protein